jgi:hypothetical protein
MTETAELPVTTRGAAERLGVDVPVLGFVTEYVLKIERLEVGQNKLFTPAQLAAVEDYFREVDPGDRLGRGRRRGKRKPT